MINFSKKWQKFLSLFYFLVYDIFMKRFLFILTLILLICNAQCTNAAQSDVKAIKNILKSQIQAANKYSYPDFIKYFDFSYVNSDGFGLDIYSKLVEDTWKSYNNIQYAQKVKNITVNGKDAIAEVVETANAKIESEYNLSGNLKSVANNVYFLKKTSNGWRIVSDVILTEDTYLSFGELSNYTPILNVPYQVGANSNYTASLEYIAPKNTIAIASINQEKVSYPQQSTGENYRKLPDDGVLERFFTANSDGVNEYIVASLGLTRPEFDNKDLQINVTGIAYVIKRVNVIPENKFIDKSGIVPVSERLHQIKSEELKKTETSQSQPEKHEIKQIEEPSIKNIENKPAEQTDTQNITPPNNETQNQEKETSSLDSSSTEQPSKTDQIEENKNTLQEKNLNTEEQEKQNAASKKNNTKKDVPSDNNKNSVTGNDAAVNKMQKNNIIPVTEPGDKVTPKKKNKKEKSLKGTYSPSPVDIPTSSTVCPIKEPMDNKSL